MSQPQNTQDYDPLEGTEKRPSVSFRDAAVGTTKVLEVQSFSRSAQTTDFDTGKPAFWKNDDGTQGNPKMAVVFDVEDTQTGEALALWCPLPSSMKTAVLAAQKASGARISPGGTLKVTLERLEPNKDRKKAPQKIYKATYTPPAPGAGEPDALAGSAPSDEPPF
jgi:hypothetical protein